MLILTTPEDVLNVWLGIGLRLSVFSFFDQPAGRRRLLVWDHGPGVGEVDADPIGRVAEDLDPDSVSFEDGREEVSLKSTASVNDRPALDRHATSLMTD